MILRGFLVFFQIHPVDTLLQRKFHSRNKSKIIRHKLKKFILKYLMPLWFKHTVIGPEQGSASGLTSRLPVCSNIGNRD